MTTSQSYEHKVRFTIDASSIQDAKQFEHLVRTIEDVAVAAKTSQSNTRTVLESGASVAAESVDGSFPFHGISYPVYFEEDGLRRLRGALREKAELKTRSAFNSPPSHQLSERFWLATKEQLESDQRMVSSLVTAEPPDRNLDTARGDRPWTQAWNGLHEDGQTVQSPNSHRPFA